MVGVTDPGISGAWLGEVLIFSEFMWKYLHVQHQKKHTSEHPLPYLRPDSESWKFFCLEQTFNIFKNIQKHISSSGVRQGHSTFAI
jgi:hypothetical protein